MKISEILIKAAVGCIAIAICILPLLFIFNHPPGYPDEREGKYQKRVRILATIELVLIVTGTLTCFIATVIGECGI